MKRAKTQAWKSWKLPTGPMPDEDGFDRLWLWQDDRCGWCGRNTTNLVEDHCHLTGLVRGFLCRQCNSAEGWAGEGVWDAWRVGENPANALKEFRVYEPQRGHTPISPSSSLHYYTGPERTAWFKRVVIDMQAGGEWPLDAPWTDEVTARRDAIWAEMRRAVSSMSFPGGAA